MGTPIGMMGDFNRGGARPIGTPVAMDFSVSAIDEAIHQNPETRAFILCVNPFYKDLAAKIVGYWCKARSQNLYVTIETNGGFAQYAWLLTPVDNHSVAVYNEDEQNSEQETVT